MSVRNWWYGILAGICGGIVFGIMLIVTGMLPMLGHLIGIPTFWGGMLTHAIVSIFDGLVFAIIFFKVVRGVWSGMFVGLVYGAILWVIGPLTALPYFVSGTPLFANWNAAAVSASIPALIGHLVFGFVLGVVYGLLNRPAVGK